MTRRYASGISVGLIAFLVLGTLATGARADLFTFSNPNPIIIPGSGGSGPANPYPSTIPVAGVTGTVIDVDVILNNFSHSFPDDLGVLLVAPGGTGAIVFQGGTAVPASNVNLTFSDGGATWPDSGTLSSGTYQPHSYIPDDTFPPPAPLISGVNPTVMGPSSFTGFNGIDPNGTWSLYVFDFLPFDTGSIAGGWSLQFTTTAVPEPATLTLFALGAVGVVGYARRRTKAA